MDRKFTKTRSLKWIMDAIEDDFRITIDIETAKEIRNAKRTGAGIVWSNRHLVIMSRDLEMTIVPNGIKYWFTWYTQKEWDAIRPLGV